MSIDSVLQMVDEATVPIRVSLYGKATSSKVGGKIWAAGVGPDGTPFSVYGPCPVDSSIAEVSPKQATVRAQSASGKSTSALEQEKERSGYQRLGTYALIRRDATLVLVEVSRLSSDMDPSVVSGADDISDQRNGDRPPLPRNALYRQDREIQVPTRSGWVF